MLRFATTSLLCIALAAGLVRPADSTGTAPNGPIGNAAPTLGDILICDVSSGLGLVNYNPTSGQLASVSASGLLVTPLGVALESSTSALVSVLGGKIIRVNLLTGAQSLVTSGNHLSANPDGLIMGPDGLLYVADLLNNSIVAVNPQTGAQQIISAGGLLSGPLFMVWKSPNELLVECENSHKIVRVHLPEGAQNVVAFGGLLTTPKGIAIDAGGRLLVVDYAAGALVAVDMITGNQQLVGTTGLDAPLGIALDENGFAYVGTYHVSTAGLTKINLVNGTRQSIPTPAMYAFGMVRIGATTFPPPPSPPGTPGYMIASDDQPDGVHLAWGQAAGAAAYRIYRDGVEIAALAPTESLYVDTPTLGTYNYCVAAANVSGNSAQVCDNGTRRAYRLAPEVHFVKDVPNDQGGRIQVAWLRSEQDSPQLHTITGYRVWRRLPSTDALRAGVVAMPEGAGGGLRTSGQSVTYWEPVTTIPSAMLDGYGVVVSTTQDSLGEGGGNPYTAFFVSALTADAVVFYNSPVDSGYSVDNLAPAVPDGFHGIYSAAIGVTLSWRANDEADISHYDVFKGPGPDFVPTDDNRLGSTADSIFVDGAGSVAFYKLVAVDVHGNASRPATLQPLDIPTSTLVASNYGTRDAGVVKITVVLTRLSTGLRALLFRGTSEEFGEASLVGPGSMSVRQLDFTMEDATASPGVDYWYWVDLVDSEGQAVLVGPIAISGEGIPAASLAPRSWPNPVRGDATIWYTIGADRSHGGRVPTTLRIFDARGRLVRSLVNAPAGPGTYQALWDRADQSGRRVASGPYYLQLTIGDSTLRGRLTLIE